MRKKQYCEFGGTAKKCEEWLGKNDKDLHDKLYSEGQRIFQFAGSYILKSFPTQKDAIAANMSSLSVDAQKRAAKDTAKKEAKAAAAESKLQEKRENSKILIKRVERTKRKYVTVVSGLEHFGLDLKKTSKDFGKKFATGSSVTKTPSGGEEIVVQGDVSDEIFDMFVDGDEYKDKIPEDREDHVECIEDKKKKGGG